LVKQTQAAELVENEDKEKQFKPVTKLLEKVEKAVIQTDEDLSKKLELLPAKQLMFDSKDVEEKKY
jgi:hypothetical protein